MISKVRFFLIMASIVMIGSTASFAQGFGGGLCVNCKGLGGPATWIFWIIIIGLLAIIAFKLFRKKA